MPFLYFLLIYNYMNN